MSDWTKMNDDGLFELDSPLDLLLRGYSRENIRIMTGIDVGYNGISVSKHLKGVDRMGYRSLHLRKRHSDGQITKLLDEYAHGMSRTDVLSAFGICGEHPSMRSIFESCGFGKEFKAADKLFRKNNMRDGCIEKYGVDNVFKLQEFQDAAADTREALYGAKYTLQNGSVLAEDARNTYIEHMSDASFKNAVMEKRRATCIERYGVDSYQQTQECREKMRQTCMERYGVPFWQQTPEFRELVSEHNKSIYSREEMANAVMEKRRATCLEKYGVEHYSQTDEFRSHISEVSAANYDSKREKMANTCMERYGVDSYNKTDEHRRLTHDIMVQHRDEIREKTAQTCMERYGVECYTQTEEFRQAQRERMLDPDYQLRIISAKQDNGTFNASSEENMFYDMLLSIYAPDDIERQYYDDRYPFACDFYIRSRDLFIELNISWTHGGGWYDGREVVCKQGSKYYENAIANWTQRDVRKRDVARENALNYVVFWLPKCIDAQLWFALGCPDGRDWEREYSWLPLRQVSVPDVIPEKGVSARNCIKAAKAIHGDLFYGQELCMWNDNVLLYGKGRIQGLLYSNRYKYLGKLPEQLSDLELLRGMSISGIMRGYSVYDTTVMNNVMGRYDIKSVYDPCAGWGERLALCGSENVSYLGVDVRKELMPGYGRLIDAWDLQDCDVLCGDSAIIDLTGQSSVDAVITCPPYHDTEIYSEIGAENLSYADFIAWWQHVVDNAMCLSPKYFMYQISGRYVDDMDLCITKNGFVLVETCEINANKVSHFNRKSGRTSAASETFRIFARKV